MKSTTGNIGWQIFENRLIKTQLIKERLPTLDRLLKQSSNGLGVKTTNQIFQVENIQIRRVKST